MARVRRRPRQSPATHSREQALRPWQRRVSVRGARPGRHAQPCCVRQFLLFDSERYLGERLFQPRNPPVPGRAEPIPGGQRLGLDHPERLRRGGMPHRRLEGGAVCPPCSLHPGRQRHQGRWSPPAGCRVQQQGEADGLLPSARDAALKFPSLRSRHSAHASHTGRCRNLLCRLSARQALSRIKESRSETVSGSASSAV